MDDKVLAKDAGTSDAPTLTTIPVSVTIGADGTHSCSPDPVPVPVGGGQVQLVFTFAPGTTGYVFDPNNAISFENQFPAPSMTSIDGDVATFRNNATAKGLFPYKVRYQVAATGEFRELSFDPMIDNQA